MLTALQTRCAESATARCCEVLADSAGMERASNHSPSMWAFAEIVELALQYEPAPDRILLPLDRGALALARATGLEHPKLPWLAQLSFTT